MSASAPTQVFHRFGPIPRSEIRAAVRLPADLPAVKAKHELEGPDTVREGTLRASANTLVEHVTVAANDPRVER